jgi:hypothetical protein
VHFWSGDCSHIAQSRGRLECSLNDAQIFGLYPINLIWLIPYTISVGKPTLGFAFLGVLALQYSLFFLILLSLAYGIVFLFMPRLRKK